MDADALLALATELRADATRHLTALAGNASMCAIGRSGRSFPAAKYHEGRQAAASQVRRALRQDDEAGGGAAGSPLLTLTDTWQQSLDAAQAKGPDWVAYAQGGLDVLAELRQSAGD